MDAEEKKLLMDFLEQLKSVRGIEKHQEAAAMIEAAVREQPDAAYLLVQKNLLQDQALGAARSEIASLRREMESRSPSRSEGFLSSNPWSSSPQPRVAQPMQAAPAIPAPGPGGVSVPGATGTGSFLGSMAATAAGVAGGAFLFQGIESMLGHHGGGYGGYGMGDAGYLGGHGAENITVNQYYGDASGSAHADEGYGGESVQNVSDEDNWDLYDDQSDSIDV